VIERVWRCTWRASSCEIGSPIRASLEIHLEAVIERVWSYTYRPWSCEIEGRNLTSLEIHLEAMIEQVWSCTCRPWLSEIGGALGGGRFGGSSSEARRNGSWDCIHWLIRDCGNVKNWVQHGLAKDERLAGCGRQSILGWCSMRCMQYSVYGILGVCCTWRMLYLVYAVLSVNSWSWHGEIERDDLTLCS